MYYIFIYKYIRIKLYIKSFITIVGIYIYIIPIAIESAGTKSRNRDLLLNSYLLRSKYYNIFNYVQSIKKMGL